MPIDMSGAKAPPSKRAASTRTTPKPAAAAPAAETKTQNQMRREGLLGLGGLIAGGCIIMGQHADAGAINNHFPNLAVALADLADEQDAVAKPIDFLIQIGPYGALITAALPLVLQIAANHKMIDATALAGQGVVPPAVLEAQMKAQVAQMQAEAVMAQQAAIREAQRAQAAYEAMLRDANNQTASALTEVVERD